MEEKKEFDGECDASQGKRKERKEGAALLLT